MQEINNEKKEGWYELWFRLAYKDLIKAKKMTAALRPGVRKCPAPKCTNENDRALIKILLKPGDEAKGLLPLFDDYQAPVIIKKIIVKTVKELTAEDLKDCSPDCRTPELAGYHLTLIYNQEFNDDDIISIVHFEYI